MDGESKPKTEKSPGRHSLFLGLCLLLLFLLSLTYMIRESSRKSEEILLRIESIGSRIMKHSLIFNELPFSDNRNEIYRDLKSLLYCPELQILSRTMPDFEIGFLQAELNRAPNDFETYYEILTTLHDVIRPQIRSEQRSIGILTLLILITTIIMGLLLFASRYEKHVVLNKESVKNSMNTRLLELLEKEQNILAFELHDDIAQKLAVVKRSFEEQEESEESSLYARYTGDVINKVRKLSNQLKTPDRIGTDLDAAIEKLSSDITVFSDVTLNVKKLGLKALIMDESSMKHLYRVIQESLNNALKHSEADTIELSLIYSHPVLIIRIRDNGVGFDPAAPPSRGLGLESMKYRLELLNGKYSIRSEKGDGTEILIEVPIADE